MKGSALRHGRSPLSDACRNRIERLLASGRGLIVGLTGGIAGGKSTVASMLDEKGAVVIDFDDLAREVVIPGSRVLDEIREIFGPEVLDSSGGLDRKALGSIVFADEGKLDRLEAVTHPRIFELYLQKASSVLEERPGSVIIAVIPLLAELGLCDLFHAVVVVYAPASVQKERLMSRDGISGSRADSMLRAQMPIEEKLACADFVVHNAEGLDETRRQVEALWRELEVMRLGLPRGSG